MIGRNHYLRAVQVDSPPLRSLELPEHLVGLVGIAVNKKDNFV